MLVVPEHTDERESLAYTHQLLCLDEEITSSLESASQDITLTPGGKQLHVAINNKHCCTYTHGQLITNTAVHIHTS